jgi:hypothetical protein
MGEENKKPKMSYAEFWAKYVGPAADKCRRIEKMLEEVTEFLMDGIEDFGVEKVK